LKIWLLFLFSQSDRRGLIESAINGTPGVTAVHSSSALGISAVKIIFNWETEIYQARQLVTERCRRQAALTQQEQSKLPEGG